MYLRVRETQEIESLFPVVYPLSKFLERSVPRAVFMKTDLAALTSWKKTTVSSVSPLDVYPE